MQSKRYKGVLHTHFEVGCFLVPVMSIGVWPIFIACDPVCASDTVNVYGVFRTYLREHGHVEYKSEQAMMEAIYGGDYFAMEFIGTIRLRNSRPEWLEFLKSLGFMSDKVSFFISEVHEVYSVGRTKKNRFWIALQKALSPLCWL